MCRSYPPLGDLSILRAFLFDENMLIYLHIVGVWLLVSTNFTSFPKQPNPIFLKKEVNINVWRIFNSDSRKFNREYL